MIERYNRQSKIRDSIIWLCTNVHGTEMDYDALEQRTEAARDRIQTLTKGDPVSDYVGFSAVQYEIILDELGLEIDQTFEATANVIPINQTTIELQAEYSATA